MRLHPLTAARHAALSFLCTHPLLGSNVDFDLCGFAPQAQQQWISSLLFLLFSPRDRVRHASVMLEEDGENGRSALGSHCGNAALNDLAVGASGSKLEQ